MHISNLEKIHWDLLKLLSWNTDVLWADVKLTEFAHWQSQIRFLQYQCIYQIWWKSIGSILSVNKNMDGQIFTGYRQEMKLWMCRGQTTVKKMKFAHQQSDSIPDLFNINAHTKFGKNPWYLLKLSSVNENTDM